MKFHVKTSKGQSFKNSVSSTVPGQALDLVELVRRFTAGQRLVVNNRPINVFAADEDGNFIDSSIKDETYENVMPDIEDMVDLEDYLEDLGERKKSIQRKKKETVSTSTESPSEEPKA